MDWLKDKKNQPIVAGALAVIILGALVAMYFMFFAGGGSSSTPPPTPDTSAGMPGMSPGGDPNAPPGMPGATSPAPPQAAQPRGKPGAVEAAAMPMEAFRADPFLPVGYRPPVRTVKPKLPIRDLPIQNWTQWLPPNKKPQAPDLPQPVRRMAGLIVSDSIYAIIETNGKSQIVQPGDVLDDRMAKVERIERDKVVLKTMDKKPKYLIVRMASAPRTETPSTSGASAPGARGSRSFPGGPPIGESPM